MLTDLAGRRKRTERGRRPRTASNARSEAFFWQTYTSSLGCWDAIAGFLDGAQATSSTPTTSPLR